VALLDIHVLGSPVLRQETTPVDAVTDDLRRLVDDMFETMHAAKGIGLAAPQVGRTERLFVAEVDEHKLAIFNPEIVTATGKPVKAEEGCLSIPEVYGDVERPPLVTMRGLDVEGQPIELSAEGLLARCMQHELDHLHGRLFIDYFGMFKRRSAMAAWEREKAKYPALRRTLIAAKDLAEQHNEEAL
jgi:peptide deformylase